MDAVRQDPMRCRICGKIVHGPLDGVAWSLGRRHLIFCNDHAPVAEHGVKVLRNVAATGLRELMEAKAPDLFEAIRDLYEIHHRMKNSA